MTARSLIAATLLIVAGSAFAADAPAAAGANAAVTAGANAAATAATVASSAAANLNLPVLKSAGVRSREAVRAEAVEAAKNHRTTLAQQLDFLK